MKGLTGIIYFLILSIVYYSSRIMFVPHLYYVLSMEMVLFQDLFISTFLFKNKYECRAFRKMRRKKKWRARKDYRSLHASPLEYYHRVRWFSASVFTNTCFTKSRSIKRLSNGACSRYARVIGVSSSGSRTIYSGRPEGEDKDDRNTIWLNEPVTEISNSHRLLSYLK